MKTECAIALNKRLNESYQILEAAYYGKLSQQYPNVIEKHLFHHSTLQDLFTDFIYEIDENMNTYLQLAYIKDYLEFTIEQSLLRKIEPLKEFNKTILKRGIEVNFILNLKSDFDYITGKVSELFKEESSLLLDICKGKIDELEFNRVTEIHHETWEEALCITEFNIKWSRANANTMKEPLDQINFWIDLKYKFQRWKLEFTKKQMQIVHKLSPNFEQNCDLEIARLEAQIEMETKYRPQNRSTNREIVSPTQSTDFLWNGSDTDLLELMTSIYELELIVRKDRKKATQKELIGLFEKLFDLEIKDPRSKLSKTVHRKKGEPNILERMVRAYSDYTSRKLERGRGGKR